MTCKNFDDYKKSITQEQLDNWYSDIECKLKDSKEIDPDNIIRYERSVNLNITFKLLEEYTKWLNK